jgi:hypothetical protein
MDVQCWTGVFATANGQVFGAKMQSSGAGEAASLPMLEIATFAAKG